MSLLPAIVAFEAQRMAGVSQQREQGEDLGHRLQEPQHWRRMEEGVSRKEPEGRGPQREGAATPGRRSRGSQPAPHQNVYFTILFKNHVWALSILH